MPTPPAPNPSFSAPSPLSSPPPFLCLCPPRPSVTLRSAHYTVHLHQLLHSTRPGSAPEAPRKRGHKPHKPSLPAATLEKCYLTTDTPTPFFFIHHRHRPLPPTTTTSHPSKRSRTCHSHHLPLPPPQKNHPTRKPKPRNMLTASGAFDIDQLYVVCARAKMRAKSGEVTTVAEEGRRWLGRNLRVGKMG
ncbi:hypothetical protein BDZ91DRAFT_714869 [Kalaharituber pfeilii]|nr:hypothetical protein BDZ91DRAFT_714869 [Kalaharituber pfeilii]